MLGPINNLIVLLPFIVLIACQTAEEHKQLDTKTKAVISEELIEYPEERRLKSLQRHKSNTFNIPNFGDFDLNKMVMSDDENKELGDYTHEFKAYEDTDRILNSYHYASGEYGGGTTLLLFDYHNTLLRAFEEELYFENGINVTQRVYLFDQKDTVCFKKELFFDVKYPEYIWEFYKGEFLNHKPFYPEELKNPYKKYQEFMNLSIDTAEDWAQEEGDVPEKASLEVLNIKESYYFNAKNFVASESEYVLVFQNQDTLVSVKRDSIREGVPFKAYYLGYNRETDDHLLKYVSLQGVDDFYRVVENPKSVNLLKDI